MQTKPPGLGTGVGHGCNPEPVAWPEAMGAAAGMAVDANLDATRARVARLARAIETEVIPRLVQHHRDPSDDGAPHPNEAEVEVLVRALVADSEVRIVALLEAVQARGVGLGLIYTDLLAPAARRLGEMWEDDSADFATVTVGLGRLQRLLRHLSPAFGSEVQHPPHGRRVVLTQPDTEQHIFGLSMVAEFFRRDGWDVLGGVAGVGIDAVAWVRRDWFDAVGFSIGSELSLDWLRQTIEEVRRVSRNPAVVVLVGGPLFTLNPGWARDVGADATTDGRTAPQLAETIVLQRVQEQSGRARSS